MKLHLFVFVTLLLTVNLSDIWLYCRLKRKVQNKLARFAYWIPTILSVLFIVYVRTQVNTLNSYKPAAQLIWGFWLIMLLYIPKITYTLFDFIYLATCKISNGKTKYIKYFGTVLAIVQIGLFIHGAFIGKDKLEVVHTAIPYKNLPHKLEGLKIVHISDLHLGNWNDRTATIEKMVTCINAENPDLVICSGDMVNNFAEELTLYIPILQKISAKYGKYAILGNHDYGDYCQWNSTAERDDNLARTKQGVRECGFDLLLNEHRTLTINAEKIKIVGVENWGKPPFKQYGDLKKSVGTNDSTDMFTILMSHDSSHWRCEVLQYPDIDLTLSGHTHAAQVGIYIGDFKWSPSKFKYEEYDGLYQENGQYMYVNRGLGFVGVPMRIGAYPEISVLTLERQK